MNLVPYLGSLALLVFAAALVGVTHLNLDPEGPLLEPAKRTDLLLQLSACAVSFIAGWQL